MCRVDINPSADVANARRTASADAWLQVARLVVPGCLALAAGLFVYLTDRDSAHAMLVPSVAAFAGLHLFGALGQWLPSFVHPFAFSLFTAATLQSRSAWRYGACAAWCAVNVAFELGQHPQVSSRLATALQGIGPASLTRPLANYLLRGTFDGGDIVAAVLGALAAGSVLWLLRPRRENADAH
jgi:hypothetical protein